MVFAGRWGRIFLQKRRRFRVGLLVSCAVLLVGADFSILGLRPMVV